MSESMVERVAEALTIGVCKACCRPCEGDGLGITPRDCERNDCEWRPPTEREMARAAIEAMRSPTPEMKSAMEPWTRVSGHQDGVWKAGIDAALNEKSPTAD